MSGKRGRVEGEEGTFLTRLETIESMFVVVFGRNEAPTGGALHAVEASDGYVSRQRAFLVSSFV